MGKNFLENLYHRVFHVEKIPEKSGIHAKAPCFGF
jgi:hypothetical protein